MQLTLLQHKKTVTEDMPGVRFAEVGDAFNTFYHERLPFELTDAQKRVLREIRGDLNTGWHMNRLLQGDVGSGKTVVALLTALLAKDNGHQAAIMAPTEILAQQHLEGLREMLGPMEVRVELLTGRSKALPAKPSWRTSKAGDIDILVGTHALIEPTVVFAKLGLAVIDEQHRFGVAQRAKLWKKAKVAPHILVMTATPIPRTLAMTAYGDLDASILDELPPGRKPIQTVHRTDAARLGVFQFLEDQIAEGRQIYLVYPLIEESATLDHKDLMDGYESIVRRFPAAAVSGGHCPRSHEAGGQGVGDGPICQGPSPNPRRHHGHRSGRERSQRECDGDRECRTVWVVATSPIERPRGSGRKPELLHPDVFLGPRSGRAPAPRNDVSHQRRF